MMGILPTLMTSDPPPKFPFRYHPSYLLWLSMLLVSLLIQATDSVPLWRFDRLRVEDGDYWLLFTGHLAHMNWSHWLLNMAGLALVAVFFSRHTTLTRWLAVIISAIIVINIGIWFWVTDLRTYVGLSGVLHGLFIYGALREIRYYPLSGYVLLLILLGKLVYEAASGPLPGSEDMAGGRVLTEAHLLGAIGGVVVWASGWLAGKMRFGI